LAAFLVSSTSRGERFEMASAGQVIENPVRPAMRMEHRLETAAVLAAEGHTLPNGLSLAGLVQHAHDHFTHDHCTHVLYILGARGHDELRLSVWCHAIATGTGAKCAGRQLNHDHRRSSPGDCRARDQRRRSRCFSGAAPSLSQVDRAGRDGGDGVRIL